MNQQVATVPTKSVIADMANRYGMERTAFESTVRATCMPSNTPVSNEEFAAFLLVAKELKLNPISKEIFAFPRKGGGIQAIVSIDGWMRMLNEHPEFDGMEFTDIKNDKGEIVAIECAMYRKDRTRPTKVIEYLSECKRATEPWKQWPARMLRHKAAIQCSRYAIGFAGVMDQDEYERMIDVTPPATSGIAERVGREADRARGGFRGASDVQTQLSGEVIDNNEKIVDAKVEEERAAEPEGAEEQTASAAEPEEVIENEATETEEQKPKERTITDEERALLNSYNLALNRATSPQSLLKYDQQFADEHKDAKPSEEALRRMGEIFGFHDDRHNHGLKATEAHTKIMAVINA